MSNIVKRDGSNEASPFNLYIGRLQSRVSQKTMAKSLLRVLRAIGSAETPATAPWHEWTYSLSVAMVAKLLEAGYAPRSIRLSISAVRGVMKEVWRSGRMDRDTFERVIDFPPIRGNLPDAGRALSKDEVQALFGSCVGYRLAARDLAIVALAYYGGLREFEIPSLSRESYDSQTGDLQIVGKGNKHRTVRISARGRERLAWYLTQRGDSRGPFFSCVSTSWVYYRIQEIGKKAGIAHFSPHDLRRTFATHLLEAGVDINTLRQLMGHASVGTTQLYDKRGQQQALKATDALD